MAQSATGVLKFTPVACLPLKGGDACLSRQPSGADAPPAPFPSPSPHLAHLMRAALPPLSTPLGTPSPHPPPPLQGPVLHHTRQVVGGVRHPRRHALHPPPPPLPHPLPPLHPSPRYACPKPGVVAAPALRAAFRAVPRAALRPRGRDGWVPVPHPGVGGGMGLLRLGLAVLWWLVRTLTSR